MANTPWVAGSEIGPYLLVSVIGMGAVWRARDTRLGRTVAIKRVKELHSECFKQEMHTIAALKHPYFCRLCDIGPDYLVLEYVEGRSPPSPLLERDAVSGDSYRHRARSRSQEWDNPLRSETRQQSVCRCLRSNPRGATTEWESHNRPRLSQTGGTRQAEGGTDSTQIVSEDRDQRLR